eukprot:CAMPEP_0196572310 /NCGR_PEP_ID=MMETSP1081-20130531/2384_1 /TAXON_ID=36882 /ORGANISM="Pyramimonas amylifera, Strain CCMP720" /LENGTH=40 /DNA_ID= /DNA_START= /DNA_END= /DNA_ORIENTATION=
MTQGSVASTTTAWIKVKLLAREGDDTNMASEWGRRRIYKL